MFNLNFYIMKIKTIDGELVNVSQKEIIWNALDALCYHEDEAEDIYLSLIPRRKGIYVNRNELKRVIETFQSKYVI